MCGLSLNPQEVLDERIKIVKEKLNKIAWDDDHYDILHPLRLDESDDDVDEEDSDDENYR